MDRPLISVILPVYNSEKYLRHTLESVFNQSFKDFELIAVNDGSHDKSLDILKEFTDPRLKIFDRSNHGLASTLNFGIEQSNSDLIARIDHDDLMVKQRLATQKQFLDTHLDVGLVGTWSSIISEAGDATSKVHHHPIKNAQLRFWFQFDNYFVHSSVMFRKSLWEMAGKYNSDPGRQPEDFDLWSRMIRLSKVYNIPNELVIYRETSGSMSRKNKIEFEKNIETIGLENIAFLQNRTLLVKRIHSIYFRIGHGSREKISSKDFAQLSILYFKSCLNAAEFQPGDFFDVLLGSMSIFKGIILAWVRGMAI